MFSFPPPSNEPEPCGSSEKLKLCRNKLLGKGSMGTRVYEGLFENSLAVAIKQIPRDIVKGIDNILIDDDIQQNNEARLLRKFNHPNVVRYFLADSDANFAYIALELCDGCLVNYIEKIPGEERFNDLHGRKARNFKKVILNDILSGLDYLHDKEIIHGDLKPQNILLRRVKKCNHDDKGLFIEGVLSDFGLSLEIDEGRRSKTAHDNLIGSDGWRAKEILEVLDEAKVKSSKNRPKKKVKGTKAIDIFSYGCVIQYVMTKKDREYYMHPFGDINNRNFNIKKENRRTYLSSAVKSRPSLDDILADMLIEICVIGNPIMRPTTKEMLKSPFFWDSETMIQFMERAFNDIKSEKSSKNYGFLKNLEEKWKKYHCKRLFDSEIPEAFAYDSKHISNPCNAQKLYNFMRIMRNIRQHYAEILTEISDPTCKALADCLQRGEDENFACYFLQKVVEALPVVYLSFIDHPKFHSYQSYYYVDGLAGGDFNEKVLHQWSTLDKVLVRQDLNEKTDTRKRSRTPSGQRK